MAEPTTTASPQGRQTALVPAQPRGLDPYAYEPSNFDGALKLAKIIADSGLAPDALQKNERAVFMIIARGRELGFSAMQSLSYIDVISNKPALNAKGKLAKVQESIPRVCQYITIIESSPSKATWETIRRGDPRPTLMSYTIEQARAAGLLGKPGWKANQEQMLRLRAAAMLCDLKYQDLLGGLDTAEDLRDVVDIEPQSARVTQAAPPPPPQTAEVKAAPSAAAPDAIDAEVEAVIAPESAAPPHDPVTGEVTGEMGDAPEETPIQRYERMLSEAADEPGVKAIGEALAKESDAAMKAAVKDAYKKALVRVRGGA